MKSKNWPRRSVLACAISLLGLGVLSPETAAQTAPNKPPAIALLDAPADAAAAVEWQNWTHDLGWKVLTPAGPANPSIDVRVQELAKAVEAAVNSGDVDPARIYL